MTVSQSLKTSASNVAKRPIDWLLAILVSWLIPLEMFGNEVTYFGSLLLWFVPIALLLPRFLWMTDEGAKRRRRAFWWTTLYVFIAGTILDLVLGSYVLDFSENDDLYVFRMPFGQRIPIEEFLFYLLGGMAVVLVYFWADEFWMRAYHIRDRHWNDELFGNSFKLVEVSRPAIAWGVALFLLGVLIQWRFTGEVWPLTWYYNFLLVVAIGPAILFYRNIRHVVNWRAFSFTCLYVLLTSCIWEVTLGLPRDWWFYKEPNGVLGWNIAAFGMKHPYPIEALLVWLAVTFDAVLAFEALKGLTYDRRPAKDAILGKGRPITDAPPAPAVVPTPGGGGS
jgi:hypothetical protein